MQKMRFMLDHMAIKLGKYLRILGYDAAWDERIRTQELILKANAEERVFLTRNRHLADRYPSPKRVTILADTDPVKQLDAVVAEYRLEAAAGLFSRCVRCNVALEDVADRESIKDRVHPNVFERHRRFFTCPNCHTVFWRGSHVRNTCTKLRLPPPQPF